MVQTETLALMQKVSQGDQHAFHTLASMLANRMFHLAYRLMGYQRSLAEDAVQEALIKIWRAAPNWRPIGSVESFVSRVVYNACMDMHRSRKPTEEIPEDYAVNDTILEGILDQEQRHLLIGAIEKLPGRQKDAILLHYMGEHSQRHVAQLLGTTEKRHRTTACPRPQAFARITAAYSPRRELLT